MPSSDDIPPDEDLLTPDDAARRLAIGIRTLNRWVAEGRVFAYRLPNGHRRFRRADIEALLTPEQSAS
jgi:excisionase family DNA binding protein